MTASDDGTVLPPDTSTPAAGPAEPLVEALSRLARGLPTDLIGLLHDVESHAVVDGTKVSGCHSSSAR